MHIRPPPPPVFLVVVVVVVIVVGLFPPQWLDLDYDCDYDNRFADNDNLLNSRRRAFAQFEPEVV